MVLLYHHLRTFGLWYLALALTGLYIAWPTVDLYRALHGRGVNPDHPSIVMLGDSHTEFVNWQILMRCPNIANSGVGGNDTTQILQRLPEVLSMKPKLVILMAGTNDARRYVPPSQTISNLQASKWWPTMALSSYP